MLLKTKHHRHRKERMMINSPIIKFIMWEFALFKPHAFIVRLSAVGRLMRMLVCQHISMTFVSLFTWWLPFLRSWITVCSHLFSLEQGRTDEAVECTEGSVILWFETTYPACWFPGDWWCALACCVQWWKKY